jgi:hypothetical protein
MLKKKGKRLKKNSNNDPMLIKQIIIRKKAQEIDTQRASQASLRAFFYNHLTLI